MQDAPIGSGKDKTILLAGLVTYGLGQSLLYVIFGPLARDIGLSEAQFGLLISASNVALVFSSPRWGRASDALGRKPVFIIGLLGFAIGYGGVAFGIQAALWGWVAVTPLFFLLLGARLIYGVFAGGVNPAAAAYIADTTDAANRAKGMASVAASGGIGSILGPAVGGGLSAFGAVVPMYAATAAAVFVAAWAKLSLREPPRQAAAAVGSKLKFTDQRVFPYLYGWFIIFLVFTAIQVITAFYVEDQIGIQDDEDVILFTSIALLSMGLISVVVQVVVMQMLKLQPKILLRISLICFGLALLLLASVSSLTELFLAYACMGMTASFAMPSLSAAASLSVRPDEQGALAGLLTAAPTVGMIFGPMLSGILYQIDPQLPIILGSVAMVLSGIYFWFVDIPQAPLHAKE